MYLADDTPRGKIRKSIIENATDEQVTMIPANYFGDIYIIGEQHKEAAEYFNIGIKKMRRLAEDNEGEFAIYMGNRYLVIRERFENYIVNLSCGGEDEEE